MKVFGISLGCGLGALVYLAIILGAWGTIAFVAYHFITKYW